MTQRAEKHVGLGGAGRSDCACSSAHHCGRREMVTGPGLWASLGNIAEEIEFEMHEH